MHHLEVHSFQTLAEITTRDTMHSSDFCPNGHQSGRETLMVGVQAWCAMLLFLLMKLVPRESFGAFPYLEAIH